LKGEKFMTHRSSFITAAGVVLGLAASAASIHGWTATHLTYLTFSGPVALPGVTLPAGTYAFQIGDVTGVNTIVTVRNKAQTQQYFMGFTEPVARPRGMSDQTSVSLAEAAPGAARPILVWYPPDSDGRKFIYRR
jgi:hypothetical protein